MPKRCGGIIIARLTVGILLLGLVCSGGCVKQTKVPSSELSVSILKGVSLSPLSFHSSDFPDFFEKAKQAGNIVSWAGDWNELSNPDNGAKIVAELAANYNYIPMIELQFFTQSTGTLFRPLDDATKLAYKNNAANFADKYKLKYLGIGIEVNTLYAKSPSDFDAFVDFYNEVYDTVKAKSPDTKVFTIFQLEMMKGLNGGLFGSTNDTAETQWSLLNRFPKSDIIAFTTYPGLIYKNPSDIPADYYSEIRKHTDKPIAFTEIGWPSGSDIPGWESSDAEQAEFVATFFEHTYGLKEEFSIWSFLYDQNTSVPFNSMGLYRRDGTAKSAWTEWLNAGKTF